MNDDFGFSRWAVLFPVLSLVALIGATVMIFTTPEDVAASANERRILYVIVAFLALSSLIQGNALFQVERRLGALSKAVQGGEPASDASADSEALDELPEEDMLSEAAEEEVSDPETS